MGDIRGKFAAKFLAALLLGDIQNDYDGTAAFFGFCDRVCDDLVMPVPDIQHFLTVAAF